MNAPSPSTSSGDLATFTIKVDGQAINSTFQVASIQTNVAVNRVPRARIVVYDGSPAEATFPISSGATFVPGKNLSIALGYDGKETLVFEGVIVKQALEINRYSASRLVVDVYDRALSMTLERKNAIYENTTDSALIGNLIGGHKGLSKSLTSTTTTHEKLVQYYASDWDMMLTRAEANAFVVIVENAKITVAPPDTSQAPVLDVSFGDSVLELEASLDASQQFKSSAIKSYAWNADKQALLEAGPSAVPVSEPGDLSSAELAKVFDVKTYLQQTGAMIDEGSLRAWSSAELLKSKLAKIRGVVSFKGSSKVAVGKTITLDGLGGRFNGKVWVSGVEHRVSEGAWTVRVSFGLSPDWFAAEAKDIAAPAASGLLPPVAGLQTGIVKQIDNDPQGEYRVLVSLPLLQAGSKGVWARLATMYASSGVGDFFYPELGDEVVVAFMNDDPRFPVIVGSVYSKKHKPPLTPDAKNSKKAIVTRSKLTISFDETDKVIEISTPGKHVIKLDDKAGSISISDSNKNSLTLSKNGIELDSASDVTIKAKGNVKIDAGANVQIAGKANVTLDGSQVAAKAKAKFSAQGSGTAELKSTGILTIQGSLVKIN